MVLPQTVLADPQNREHSRVEIRANFHIRLSGGQQAPAINTDAFGFASLRLSDMEQLWPSE